MIDICVERYDYPDGVCNLAPHYASNRLYCRNAATCEAVIDGEEYRACDACLLDVVKSGVLERAA